MKFFKTLGRGVLLFVLLCLVGIVSAGIATWLFRHFGVENANNEVTTLLLVAYLIILLCPMLLVVWPKMKRVKAATRNIPIVLGILMVSMLMAGTLIVSLKHAGTVQTRFGIDSLLMMGIILCPFEAVGLAGLWTVLKLSE